MMLANLAASLIEHLRVRTTVPKAKAVRPIVERLITLGKRGDLAARRLALSRLNNRRDVVSRLFSDVAPAFKSRQGGYTRIVKVGHRSKDAAPMAIIEWTETVVDATSSPEVGEKTGGETASA
jgi:large subunit ribosomal protein L17